MFKYIDNAELKKEFKKIVIDNNSTMSEVARKCGLVPQQLNNRFNNNRIGLNDLNEWCNAINCDLYIEIKQKKEEENF